MPSGILPFGIVGAVGYAPNTADGQGNSAKNTGAVNAVDANGQNATQYRLTAAPIEGLTIGADYYEVGGATSALGQEHTSGNYYAKYAIGNFKIGTFRGYMESGADKHASASADTATAIPTETDMTSDGLGIEFAVNDQMSISYSEEEYERSDYTMGATASTKTTSSQLQKLLTFKQLTIWVEQQWA